MMSSKNPFQRKTRSISLTTALQRCGATAEQARIEQAELVMADRPLCPLMLQKGDYLLTKDAGDYDEDGEKIDELGIRISGIHQITSVADRPARDGYASPHQRGYTAKPLYSPPKYFRINLWRDRWPDNCLRSTEPIYHPEYVYRPGAGLFVLRPEKPKRIRRSSRKPPRGVSAR